MSFTAKNVNKRGKDKHEFCWFYSKNASLETLCITNHNVRTLIIIGQPNVVSFDAISKLTRLQELWIVECGIKDVSFLSKCGQLEKLYLYSNEIDHIPNLKDCPRLRILSLSGNNIRNCRNINRIPWVEELNLANNKLYRVSRIFSKQFALCYINLAGNYIHSLKDVKNLAILQKLNSVVFADPLYGECPLVALCNYRFYVINSLPRMRKLDHYSISDEEKHYANSFYKKQTMFYNMKVHKQLNEYLESIKDKQKQHQNHMLYLKEQLYAIKTDQNKCISSKSEDSNKFQDVTLKIIESNKKLAEWKKMESLKLKIHQQQLLINMNSSGNIKFFEYNTDTENNITQLCQKILKESLCPVLTNVGVTGIMLHKVTKVINKEMCGVNMNGYKESGFQADTNVTLKILASPFGVTAFQSWPFILFETALFIEKEIIVTDCLAIADSEWLSEKILSDKKTDVLQSFDVYKERRICIFIQTPCTNNIGDTVNKNIEIADESFSECLKYHAISSGLCQKHKLTTKSIRYPIFVIEYEYTSRNAPNINLSVDKTSDYDSIFHSNSTMYKRLSLTYIAEYVNMEEHTIYNLVKISITGQNINRIDTKIYLPNLRELDISFNRFETFPNSMILKNVKVLNISFNSLRSACIIEILPMLEDLNISWNCLTQCLDNCEIFKTFIPNVTRLNMENNPFCDIINFEEFADLLQCYLPKLQFINNNSLEHFYNRRDVEFQCALSTCKQNRQCEKETKVIHALETSEVNATKLIEHIDKTTTQYSKYIHISNNSSLVISFLRNASTLQEFCGTHCALVNFPTTKPFKYLIKLNLSSNCIMTLKSFTQENFPVLKYLDLSNNLIFSLKEMGSFHTLQEFYCAHNKINTLAHIENVKTWHMLWIIDLCNNPLVANALYKSFIVYHLAHIKYVSGESVQCSDIIEARYLFGNTFHTNILSSLYKTNRLINITQLSIVNCFLQKVDLFCESLPHLQSLDLSQNKITTIRGLQSFQCLDTLCLSYNYLEAFEDSDIENRNCAFPNLHTLFLDHNCIKSLTNIMKQKMPAIKHLFLHYNCLQNIEGISQCSTLKRLILDNNEIEILSEQHFHKDNKIKTLFLENNKIESLEFVKSLRELEKLYIANNRVKNEAELQYLTSLEYLQELTLEGNPLHLRINDTKAIIEGYELKEFED